MKTPLPQLALALSLSLAAAVSVQAKTIALLTGVGNYDDPRNNLACLDADMANIQRLMSGPLAVAPEDLLVITERKATAPNILESFRNHLVKRAGPQDTVVFYYSGHGYHIPDHNGDESDGQDEILAPYGTDILKESSYVTDDQIGALLKELRCARAIVILDSCHSGTGSRGINDAIVKSWKPPYEAVLPLNDSKATGSFDYKPRPRNDSFGRLPVTVATPKLETLVFMACKPEETALGPKSGSLFTARLVAELTAHPDKELGQVMKVVSEDVANVAAKAAKGHKQLPQFEGSPTARLVASSGTTAPAPSVAVAPARPPQVASPTPSVSPIRPTATPPANPAPTPAPVNSPTASAPRLSPLPNSSPVGEIIQHRDFAVLVQLLDANTGKNLAGTPIKIGTEVQVQVQPARDCYVRLYHVDATGRVTLVFPNVFQKTGMVTAESKARFPAANGGFRFVIEEPLGLEVIKAVCSNTPFQEDLLPPEQGRPFYRLPGLHSGELSSRGLGAYATLPANAPASAAPVPNRQQAENYVNYLVVR